MRPADLLDPRGRMRRRQLAAWSLLPFVVLAALADAANDALVTTAFWLLIAWPVLVAHPWRRMHDVGRAGRWNLVFYAFYALGFGYFFSEWVPAEGGWSALFDGAPASTPDDALTASGLGGFSTVLIFLPIQLAWLYLIPGQRGPNPYGPDPRAPSHQE